MILVSERTSQPPVLDCLLGLKPSGQRSFNLSSNSLGFEHISEAVISAESVWYKACMLLQFLPFMEHAKAAYPLDHVAILEQTHVDHAKHLPEWTDLLIARQCKLPAFQYSVDDDILIVFVVVADLLGRDIPDAVYQIIQEHGEISTAWVTSAACDEHSSVWLKAKPMIRTAYANNVCRV